MEGVGWGRCGNGARERVEDGEGEGEDVEGRGCRDKEKLKK